MRTHGTLIRWNDERGFGFIEPAGGADALFVHVSSFPRDGVRPEVGELVSFDIDTRSDGKTCAVRVMRPGGASRSHRTPQREHSPRPARRVVHATRSSPPAAISLLVVIALGVYVCWLFNSERQAPPRPTPNAARSLSMPHRANFTCDGRTMCSQMSSCAEATYFLEHCPAVTMDGDGDGVPCERQWCDATVADDRH